MRRFIFLSSLYFCIVPLFILITPLAWGKLLITEIQIEGITGEADNEYVKITNVGKTDEPMKNFILTKQHQTSTCTTSNLISTSTDEKFPDSLKASETLIIVYKNASYSAPFTTIHYKSNPLTGNDILTLFDATKNAVDTVGYGNTCQPYAHPAPQPGKNQQLVRKKDAQGNWQDTGNNANDFETHPLATPPPTPTPSPSPTSPTTIRLNEILPNPLGNEKLGEYIELFNFGSSPVNLKNWTLRDASKTGHYTFPNETLLAPRDFLVIPRTAFVFALNNGNETVSLFDPNNTLIDTVYYGTTTEQHSYNFSESGWRWSQFLTPGRPNRFDAAPVSETSFPKDGYVDMPVDFSARASDADGDSVKYTWDFGDGHKSYKAETTHTYKKAKNYTVTLTINDGSEPVVKTKKIIIERYPHRKVRIVSMTPNPAGADTGTETIVLQNLSKKTVRLKNWKIATQSTATSKNKKGASKKAAKKKVTFTNHLITTTIVLKPKQTVSLTHADSKFSLNNTAGKIALRTPDNKTLQTVAYAAPTQTIGEDARYVRHPVTHQWAWIPGKSSPTKTGSTSLAILASPPDTSISEATINQKVPVPSEPATTPGSMSLASQKQSPSPLQPLVLGTYTVNLVSPIMTLSPPPEVAFDFFGLISETINGWMQSIF